MFKCLICNTKFSKSEDLVSHIEDEHEDSIPKDYTAAQLYYEWKTGKTEGSCVVCKQPTKWNPATGKYCRFCEMPACKKKYREMFKSRMIEKHGKVHLLNDPEQQKNMLANRSISGKYKWSDGVEIPYTGSYELEFLKFLDVLMQYSSADIMSPSPHVYYYHHEGKLRFYIPDYFIPSLNLEIEIKDGGDNPNNHHKIQDVDKKKEMLKDEVLLTQTAFNYIKIVNKNYDPFFAFLHQLKNKFEREGESGKPIFIVEPPSRAEVTDKPVRVVVSEAFDNIDGLLQHDEDDADKLTPFLANLRHLFGQVDTLEQAKFLLNIVDAKISSLDHPTNDDKTLDVIRELNIVRDALIVRLEVSRVIKDDEWLKVIQEATLDVDNLRGKQKEADNELVPVYVLLTHSGTMLANAIKAVTKNPYSHASISFDTSLDNMYSFGRKYKDNPLIGTFVKESIRQGLYNDVKETATYSLYVTFVTREERRLMEAKLQEFKDNKDGYKYNFTGLIKHQFGVESNRDDAYFCSEFVDTILKASGKQYFDRGSSLVKPYDYAKHKDFIFVSKGLLKNYDENKVKDIVDNIYQMKF